MIKRIAIVAIAVAGICSAVPASADEVGVAVGPIGAGVTVGTGHGDAYREHDREVIRERDHRDHDETVVIKNGEHDRDIDRDHKTVIIDRQ